MNKLIRQAEEWANNNRNFRLAIFIALAARLVLFASDGHNHDFDFFEYWAERMVDHGFTNIYQIQADRFECDYPPLYLYIIAFTGHLFNMAGLEIHSHLFSSVLKFITLLAEAGFIFYAWRLTKNRLFIVALLLNPITLINAYAWGQIDLLYTALLFCSIIHALRSEIYASAVFLGLSLALKTQTLLFMPLMLVFLLKAKASHLKRLLGAALVLFIYLLPNLPFIIGAPDPMDSFTPHLTASGRYDYISVNAFNIWWALWADYKFKVQLLFPPNNELVFGLITRKSFALIISGIIYLAVLAASWRKLRMEQQIALISFFCLSFFMFLPEMHERYLFPFFIFSCFLLSAYRSEWKFFTILAFLHAFNLIWAWGEQKFLHQVWLFQVGQAAGLISFVIWIWYAVETWKRLKTNETL